MKVMKFGGSSVANVENIIKVAEIVRTAVDGGVVVVLSAMQGTTDSLIEVGRRAESGDEGFRDRIRALAERHFDAVDGLIHNDKESVRGFVESSIKELERICEGVFLLRELSPRSLDNILGFGELLSTRIASHAFAELGIENEWKDSRELIRTDSSFGSASVDFITTDKQTEEYFSKSREIVHILPGFVASDASGITTTLGRGGSDYTAAIIAAGVNADVLEIWTDVSGMMTADPRFVKNVRQIPRITYREAMELSHFGAKVIYPPTIQPVMAKNIPVLVKNTFAPNDEGTLIEPEAEDRGEIIRGITSIDKIALLSLEGSGMVGIPGFSKRLFDALARAQINVILITQSSSEHSICAAIEDKFGAVAKRVVDAEFEHEISVGKIEPLGMETGFSILALVGDNMKSHTGVSGRMFSVLGHNGININAIAQGSSERNISAVIRSNDVRKAVNTLHEEFFSDGRKQVNVYVAGVGTVGGRLLDQIKQQKKYLLDDLRLNVRIVGLANSKRSVFTADEDKELTVEDLANGDEMTTASFTDIIIANNKRNSVFVDVTASADVVKTYEKLLAKSVSVIACNKIACSSDYDSYHRLKSLAREYDANFFFETNVGAGLPVISTLNDLLRSGDRVNRIEAVLSGTLNFVFNNYDGSRQFASVVRQAQDEGYTEPDPRLDLSGTDVARKILILAREAGYKLEMEEIDNTSFLPDSCLKGSVDDFYLELEKNEGHFRKLSDDAAAKGLSLKYIASFDSGKASVGLRSIGPDHNFANLSGKDNAVLFYTNRYSEQPLVIKGAGAGADVTAAGVFADIIRAARS
ncbi:MAG TPA: bifunctional aspartate kinase/homoserine dehydrogenase I [Pyrinomonadaceae bacterium]|nr:bifunctional aspartate kinase/homoserine dehydrogenase I [Pyrinomonadaceae bacterium]